MILSNLDPTINAFCLLWCSIVRRVGKKLSSCSTYKTPSQLYNNIINKTYKMTLKQADKQASKARAHTRVLWILIYVKSCIKSCYGTCFCRARTSIFGNLSICTNMRMQWKRFVSTQASESSCTWRRRKRRKKKTKVCNLLITKICKEQVFSSFSLKQVKIYNKNRSSLALCCWMHDLNLRLQMAILCETTNVLLLFVLHFAFFVLFFFSLKFH